MHSFEPSSDQGSVRKCTLVPESVVELTSEHSLTLCLLRRFGTSLRTTCIFDELKSHEIMCRYPLCPYLCRHLVY